VDAFYAKVRVDPELAPFFERALGNLDSHLATMYDFWSSVMLISGRYKGIPVEKHRRLNGIEPRLFDRWLQLSGRLVTKSSMTMSRPFFVLKQHASLRA
jgi:hemoglobin